MRSGVDMDEVSTQTNVPAAESPVAAAARERAMSALGRLEHGQRDAMDELRESLCGFVGTLRQEGWTREATLATVRTLIATPVTPDGAVALTPIVRDALAELTLEWCQAEYDRLAAATA
ncbi:MAG TPA: hypothetical protein VJW73_22680 [Gemmatimonadaceae bacterium]|nr:hypothetical protein [Gemmatimonadaceae bacterium]